jgi:lipopolysaccharide biosynthesis regulator YciM
METGFLLDHGHGSFIPTLSVKDSPVRSFWTLTKIKGKMIRRVDSYRCVECGYLESYATNEWKNWPKS